MTQVASTGSAPTPYSFTGQYSYQSDFGLMFYNARWVDVSLGRFAQADSIIPSGSQGLDRYAYANNAPVKYIDPSGHCSLNGHWMPNSNSACQWASSNQGSLNGNGNGGYGCSANSSVNHYCQLGNNAVIDVKHYNDDLAEDFWQQLLNARKGQTNSVTLTSYVGVNEYLRMKFTQTYTVNIMGMDRDQLKQVGAAIWWEYQFAFEAWEGNTFPIMGTASAFANNDIASTFMAYAAEANNIGDFYDVIQLFPGEAIPTEKTESKNHSCIYTAGACGIDTSRNKTIYLKAQDADGNWIYQTYPDALNITPLFDHQYYSLTP